MAEPRMPRTKFSQVPNIVLTSDLSHTAKLLFVYLASYTAGNDVAYPSILGLESASGMSHTTICRCLVELEDNGLIVKHVSKSKKGEDGQWNRANTLYDLSPAWAKNQVASEEIARSEIADSCGPDSKIWNQPIVQNLESASIPKIGIEQETNNTSNNNHTIVRFDFESFFAAFRQSYPKSNSANWALTKTKLKSKVKTQKQADEVLEGLKRYSAHIKATQCFVKMPQTYAHQEEWNAEYATPSKSNQPKKHVIDKITGEMVAI